MSEQSFEEWEMLEPLESWLWRTRRVRDDTMVIREFSWMGRRVDLATYTHTGRATAYELKLYKNFNGIRQAVRNSFSFNRSYVVTATRPSFDFMEMAVQLKIGILVYSKGRFEILVRAPQLKHSSAVSNRLRQAIESRIGS